MTLTKRPFGLVKINTADYYTPSIENAGLQPTSYSYSVAVPTAMNMFTGAISNTQTVNISSTIADVEGVEGQSFELSYDYFFATEDNQNILPPFTVNYNTSNEAVKLAYEFNNIPVKRNYITNITGNILTKEGGVTVSLDQTWAGELQSRSSNWYS